VFTPYTAGRCARVLDDRAAASRLLRRAILVHHARDRRAIRGGFFHDDQAACGSLAAVG
jgi:hypothetical protein